MFLINERVQIELFVLELLLVVSVVAIFRRLGAPKQLEVLPGGKACVKMG
jgi:hypothetical protein